MITSYSQNEEYVTCPRKWWYSHVERLQPLTFTKALDMGKIFADACELFTLNYHEQLSTDIAISKYMKDVDTTILDDAAQREIGLFKHKCVIMLQAYRHTMDNVWSPTPEAKMTQYLGRHSYHARADLIYTNKKNELVLREIKTKGNITGDYIASLPIREQTTNMFNIFGFDKCEYVLVSVPSIVQTAKESPEQYLERLKERIVCTTHPIIPIGFDLAKIKYTAERISRTKRKEDAHCNTQACVNGNMRCKYLPLCTEQPDARLGYIVKEKT